MPPPAVVDAIHARFGLIPTATQLPRIAAALAQLPRAGPTADGDTDTAVDMILTSPLAELRPLIAAATVNESYFFRDSRQMDVLRHDILPWLLRRRREEENLRLSVWSAAAAEGQELHTITLLLHQVLPDIARWNLRLIGTDINPKSLGKARAGLYTARDLRTTPAAVRDRYFQPEGKGFRLSPRIAAQSRFVEGNITDPTTSTAIGTVDLVLCRNVLIYFDDEATKLAMSTMSAVLEDDGFLVLGHAEVLGQAPMGLQLDNGRGVYFFRPQACPPAALIRPAETTSVMPSTGFPVRLTEKALAAGTPAKIPAPRMAPSTAAEGPTPAATPVPEPPPDPTAKAGTGTTDASRLSQLHGAADWGALWVEANRSSDDEHASYAILALAGLGRHEDAAAALERALADHSASPTLHYVAALVQSDRGLAAGAAASLRRALYLRRDFPEAEIRFALVLEDLGDSAAARPHFARALDLLDGVDPDGTAMFEPGLRYGAIAAWLRAAHGPADGSASASPEQP